MLDSMPLYGPHQAPLSSETLQARTLEWVAMPSSRGSSWPKDPICISYVSGIDRLILYQWAAREPHTGGIHVLKIFLFAFLLLICLACLHAKSLQSCVTLCNPMNCSLPGSSVHGFSRQEHWNGLPCPPLGDLPNPGIKSTSFMSPALAGEFFTTSTTWEAR